MGLRAEKNELAFQENRNGGQLQKFTFSREVD